MKLNELSPDQGGDQAIPLPDLIGMNEPYIAASALHCGAQNALPLHIDHDRMDGSLVALGVQSHPAHKVRTSLGTLLNQSGADRGAGQCGEVHWIGLN